MTGNKPTTAEQAYAAWYMQQAGGRLFQHCGQSQPWRVIASVDLPARTKAFSRHTGWWTVLCTAIGGLAK